MVAILGIDPGDKTGVAIIREGVLGGEKLEFFEVHGGYTGFVDWWENNWSRYAFDRPREYHIIYEQFDLRNNDFVADITPKEIIGMLRYWARLHDVTLWKATPAAHKGLITNEALKRAGLYPPRGEVKEGHSTDGMRLAAYHRIHHLRDREFSERLFPKNNN